MARPEPTITASRPVIVVTLPLLLVRGWKYLISLSIVLVVELSTKHSSSSIWIVPIGLSIMIESNILRITQNYI